MGVSLADVDEIPGGRFASKASIRAWRCCNATGEGAGDRVVGGTEVGVALAPEGSPFVRSGTDIGAGFDFVVGATRGWKVMLLG
jgi:hypothetical protein